MLECLRQADLLQQKQLCMLQLFRSSAATTTPTARRTSCAALWAALYAACQSCTPMKPLELNRAGHLLSAWPFQRSLLVLMSLCKAEQVADS